MMIRLMLVQKARMVAAPVAIETHVAVVTASGRRVLLAPTLSATPPSTPGCWKRSSRPQPYTAAAAEAEAAEAATAVLAVVSCASRSPASAWRRLSLRQLAEGRGEERRWSSLLLRQRGLPLLLVTLLDGKEMPAAWGPQVSRQGGPAMPVAMQHSPWPAPRMRRALRDRAATRAQIGRGALQQAAHDEGERATRAAAAKAVAGTVPSRLPCGWRLWTMENGGQGRRYTPRPPPPLST